MNKRKNTPKILPTCTAEYYKTLFDDYLTYQRVLSQGYRQQLCRVTRLFLNECFGSEVIDFSRVTAKNVVDFISNFSSHESPHRTQSIACCLRALLRFLHLKNLISTDLSTAIPRVAVWRLDRVPNYLTKNELKLVLKHCDRKTLNGLRDYTIIRILSSLGLRAFEVAQLSLDDID